MDETQRAMLEGLNRQDLHWNPSINYELCQQCGICVDFCKHGVYALESDKVKVVQPTGCVILCNNCEPQCPNKAISFPNKNSFLKEVRELRIKTKNAV